MPVSGRQTEEEHLALPWVLHELTRNPAALLQRLGALANFSDDPCLVAGDDMNSDPLSDEGLGVEDEEMPDSSRGEHEFLQPSPTSLLYPGQCFNGVQRLTTRGATHHIADDWKIRVKIEGYEPARGYICGTMEALNVPNARSPVMTFWEGEIIDNVHHTFFTQKWGASYEKDLEHWAKFDGGRELRTIISRFHGRNPSLHSSLCIYMRWKDLFFVNAGPDCGLTIAGFYYMCLNRADGTLTGFYYDPCSTPFQKIELVPVRGGVQGTRGKLALGTYSFC